MDIPFDWKQMTEWSTEEQDKELVHNHAANIIKCDAACFISTQLYRELELGGTFT